MKGEDIAEGFYYTSKGRGSVLRLVVRFEKGRVRWVDTFIPGECYSDYFIRWGNRRLTADQARAQFPDEVKLIEATCERYHPLLGRPVPLVMSLVRLEEY